MQNFHKIFLILIFSALFFGMMISCQNEEETTEPQVSYLDKNAEALSKKIDLQGTRTAELSSKTQEVTSDWNEFLSAHSEIEKIKSSSLQNFIHNANNLSETVAKATDSIPDALDHRAVESRINVLNTKIKVMVQNLDRSDLTPEMINEDAKEIYNAFQNLKIQLNEVFLPQVSELDFDMDARQDSIQDAKEQKRIDPLKPTKPTN